MERNDLTLEELKYILVEKYSYASESTLKRHGIIFKDLRTEYDMMYSLGRFIIPLKKGIAQIKYQRTNGGSKVFTPNDDISKLSEEELTKIAREYQILQEKTDLMKFVLEEEKIRGLFAKMKATK